MDTQELKELAKKAIVEEVYENLEKYFDYVYYQTDVDDYYFRCDGVLRDSIELDIDEGDRFFGKLYADWYNCKIDSDLDFFLYDVNVTLEERNEDGATIKKHDFFFKKI